jgi:hypothetical protein
MEKKMGCDSQFDGLYVGRNARRKELQAELDRMIKKTALDLTKATTQKEYEAAIRGILEIVKKQKEVRKAW